MDVSESTASIPEVVVSLVVSTTTGAFPYAFFIRAPAYVTNFDKYHPGYFGKVGMRHFHLTRNLHWRTIINVDKLWTLVPAEEKADISEDSDVVPVIDALQHGYAKVLGNGQLPKLPFILKARYVSKKAEEKIKEAGGVVKLVA
ncbi:hypothetical protein PHLCEN_2v7607 [Hermanssonia centrifuga]|uniref:Large ribosomal subunit protein uL15/eL18 domain-containing protein n=1 Tax=Hermanssonia centrifuga TaxID=98765 RepID=A0A2R6NW19_9APHY|nr:hypothetical protein PHLCEN_2v7607 [Hermanssonia centrifuga]